MKIYTFEDNEGRKHEGWNGTCSQCGCQGLHFCMGKSIIPKWPDDIGQERGEDELHEVQRKW